MSAIPTAHIITKDYTRWPKIDLSDMPFLEQDHISSSTTKSTRLMSVYSGFLTATALLAGFFAVSLILAFTTQYFIDWGSALVGFLGTAGLAAVGWFSKRQIES